jgi:poly(3-hydroxybutyrate) depolymerase
MSGPSAGCGKPAKTGLLNGSTTVAGTNRTYIVSVPPSYQPGQPVRLAFGWHGLGGSGAAIRAGAGVENAAQGGAIFVYADGLPVAGGKPGWDLDPSGRDFALFDALFQRMTDDYCIDTSRVLTFGFSFGAYMSNALGCHRSNRIRAIGATAGGGPSGTCGGKVAAWVAHAADDSVVPLSSGVASRDHWIAANGCSTASTPTSPSPCVAYQNCGASPVVWCQRASGGHGFPPSNGASIWSFFAGLQ